MQNRTLRILPSAELDHSLWDRCVQQDGKAKVYNYNAYLDCFAPDWQGLVLGDYEACIPLPAYKRLGSQWLQMPPFIQQFNLAQQQDKPVTEMEKQQINKLLKKQYKLIRYSCTDISFDRPPAKVRTNYVLDLSETYKVLQSRFNKNGSKNIRKTEAFALSLTQGIPVDTVIAFYKAAYGTLNTLKDDQYLLFKKLCATKTDFFTTQTYGVSNANGELIFAALLIRDAKALYYVLGAPNEEGRKKKATYFFIHEIIKQHAGQPLKLDFEGSDLKNVADFYLSFGPETEPYQYYQLNNYAFPAKPVIKALTGI
ncbi:hypothetical protein DBR32_01960 [Taibaiella sp. KBW10]|uniref:hypothetical protein n=1 Tax=Taibaiella sp. KBW10 TaxID=2153357 RepID=UPI000F592F87|nr:hypothetical protein [Taibaiella sp. KBW10]RQO32393.1 hypothetical protein DBR32_01960 [Taibaiella sp. KBW10]